MIISRTLTASLPAAGLFCGRKAERFVLIFLLHNKAWRRRKTSGGHLLCAFVQETDTAGSCVQGIRPAACLSCVEKILYYRIAGVFLLVGKADQTRRKFQGNRHLDQLLFSQFFFHEFPYDTGYAQADPGKFDQQIHRGNLQDIGKFHAMLQKNSVDILPGDVFFHPAS